MGMLVLARKVNQRIVIDGRTFVKILSIEDNVVKLGIEAPLSVPVHREEVYEAIQSQMKRQKEAELNRGTGGVPPPP